MKDKDYYSNGQIISVIKYNIMTTFYKSGKIKAEGPYKNGMMEGEWKFYKEDGRLWQIGHLKKSNKEGLWTKFDEDKNVIYKKVYINGHTSKDWKEEIVES